MTGIAANKNADYVEGSGERLFFSYMSGERWVRTSLSLCGWSEVEKDSSYKEKSF